MVPKKRTTKRDPLAIMLGRAVRAERDKLEMTQDELAHRSDVHRAYMSAIEQGEFNITVRKLKQVCGGLGIPPSELLARIGL
jgi:transcriptional regulator with XRE-family HTH domain